MTLPCRRSSGRRERVLSAWRQLNLFRLEAAKRPAGEQSEQQKSNRRAKQQNRDRQEFLRALEPAAYAIEDQVDDPPHDPCGGYQQPDAQQSAPPIDLRR